MNHHEFINGALSHQPGAPFRPPSTQTTAATASAPTAPSASPPALKTWRRMIQWVKSRPLVVLGRTAVLKSQRSVMQHKEGLMIPWMCRLWVMLRWCDETNGGAAVNSILASRPAARGSIHGVPKISWCWRDLSPACTALRVDSAKIA